MSLIIKFPKETQKSNIDTQIVYRQQIALEDIIPGGPSVPDGRKP